MQRIYDCFPFYNELDILEIRLNVLNEVVDYFVLVESTRTFSGKKKELIFDKNKNRFSEFEHKIRHIVVDDSEYDPDVGIWQREFDQKNAVFRGINDCSDDDFVIVSDVDEIVNPDAIKHAITRNPNSIAIFKQPCFYYYLNCRSTEIFYKARMAKYKFINSPQKIRNYPKFVTHGKGKFKQILLRWAGSVRKRVSLWMGFYKIYENGGWHFTYMKSANMIKDKISDFSHTEFDTDEYTSVNAIETRISQLKDPFDREFIFEIVEIDKYYPKYILDNKDKYNHLIFNKLDG
jgi:beta-1,4-mannosyl-glycoprotein beta-1,4-N-acetylglucosaminyltransferase